MQQIQDFVHLHLHSEYSLLDGACRIADIPKKAKEMGQSAVAITDHGAMYGIIDFYKACKKEGVKPIIGCEVYVAARTRFDKVYAEDAESYHLVLLCENETGYKNLIKLVSLAFTEGFYIKPRVDKDLLRKHSKGLIALSACLSGRIPTLLRSSLPESAAREAAELQEIFGKDNFFLELQDHGIADQKKVNQGLKNISQRLDIPLVATNDVHYLVKSDADTQAVMMCIQTNSRITDGRPVGFETEEFYFKSAEQMAQLFSDTPQAISNTLSIAQRCNLDFEFGKYLLPVFETPNGEHPVQYLRDLAIQGLGQRIKKGDIVLSGSNPESTYLERMSYELDVISSMGYAEYYLIVRDFVCYAKNNGIPVGPGRGSGAGSLIAYLLRITDVDPIRYGLIFERFLNPERVSMPDFDIDFCYIRRDEVIKYVTEKYGSERVSQIITFGTMAAKAAIRDAARAMGMPYSDGDAVVRAMPKKFGVSLDEAEKSKEFSEIANVTPEMRRLVNTAKKLEGMPRHASTHAAGIVIADRDISDYVPLAISGEMRVTQFNMETVAELGLLKFDFLGLRNLTVISDAEKMIRKDVPDFDIEKIPEDDPATFSLLQNGQTTGVFQLESNGMRQMLTVFQPRSIADIMIAISMYRPGPMEAIPKLIENRAKGKVQHEIKELAPILDETYGCIVYQEQVMQIFRTLASYSYGKADVVRRAISKKKPEVIAKQRDDFLSGCAENGIDTDKAATLFDEIVGFAGYAFNKSHAASYSVVAYRTAYLKAHYPAQFFAALMTSELSNHPKLSVYMAEAAKKGIALLSPSINHSGLDFTVDGGNIRYGLSALKNVGINFVASIIREREKNGAFSSFSDFCKRLYGKDFNKKHLETLIKAGAFNCLGLYRSRLLEKYEDIIADIASDLKKSLTGQMSLFGDSDDQQGDDTALPDIPEYPLRTLLCLEYDAAGMYFSGHITGEYSENAADVEAVPIASVIAAFDEISPSGEFRDGQNVIIHGVIRSKDIKNTRSGDPMIFATVEDATSEIEIIVFPKLYLECHPLVIPDDVIAVFGNISAKDDDAPKIMVKRICPMRTNDVYTHRPSPFSDLISASHARTDINKAKSYVSKKANVSGSESIAPATDKKLYLRVPSIEDETAKKAISITSSSKGQSQVIFYEKDKNKYLRRSDLTVSLTPSLISQLKKLLGDENVVIK